MPNVWPALMAFALIVFLGLYSWRRRGIPGAQPFAVGCLFAALWTLGTVLEIVSTDYSHIVFWLKFQVVWQLPSATALMCFVFVYAGLGRWLTRRNLILLTVPPVLFLGLIITNDYHQLVWTGFQISEYVDPDPGLANRVFLIYGYVLGLVNVIVLLWLAIRSPQHRWPVAIILFGQIVGRGVFLLDHFIPGALGPGEFALFMLGLISSMYAIALFRFHVFDPVPVARTAVLEQMHEGMLVVDLNGKIVDLNPVVERILGKSAANLRGQKITEVLPVNLNPLDKVDKSRREITQINLGNGKALRYYDLNITSLVDKRDQVLGQLLLLHEVTEQKRAQEQVLEQQQAMATLKERERLARELHDGTGQVLGYVNLQTQTIRKWLQAGDNEKADSLLIRLGEVARETHADLRESIHSLKAGSDHEWSFLSALRQYLADFQAHYDIHTELVMTDGLKEVNFKPGAEVQLLRVIQEALTNTRKHSGAHNVRVAMQCEKSWGTITVTDDGHGFDPGQVNQQNGRHFGLGFMRERMEQIAGSVTIESHPGAGTVVKLKAPLHYQQETT